MYCAVDLEQAHYYLQKIHEKLSNERMNIDFKCKNELFKLYAQVLINLGDFATALLICDNLKEMCELDASPEYEYDYHLLHAYTQMYNGKVEFARKSAQQCKSIALKIGDESYIFRAEMLNLMVETSGWHNIYFLIKDVTVSENFIKKVEEYGYYNHLAYIYVYAYDNDFEKVRKVKSAEEFEEKLVKYREGVELAEKLGNMCLIRKAYRKVIMMTSAIGLFHITEHYYDKYIEWLGDSDEKELAGDFNSAYSYLKICTNIIREMRLNDLRVCNIAKIYGLLALCSARLSFEYDSLFYLNTNRKFLEHIINNRTYRDVDNIDRAFNGNDDELFLHYFVNGLLEEKNR